MMSSFICNDDASDEFLCDTTGTALSWFFYLVYKNPRIKQKILDKLMWNTAMKKLEDIMVFDISKLSSLVYLHVAMCQ